MGGKIRIVCKMTILDKVLEIYQVYFVCPKCLGRMFSLLGTNTTNLERGTSLLLTLTMENHRKYLSVNRNDQENVINNLKILAEKANYLPAQKVLENEGFEYNKNEEEPLCYLCENIFQNVQNYVDQAIKEAEDIEYNNFLVGISPNSQIINQEDKFKSELNILEAESFKSHFNRVVGIEILKLLNKPPEFNNPDLVFLFYLDFNSFKVKLLIKPVFISGRYNKLIRGIPQTLWICQNCKGKGCEECNFTGKKYETSIEESISPEFIKEAKAKSSKFHGAGREDIDVRMLGTGRPFVIELKEPQIRTLDLNKIMERVNQLQKGKIQISDLKYSKKKEVIHIKEESKNTRKVYKALVEPENEINEDSFENLLNQLKSRLESQIIHQRTPNRVSHRRADKIREKTIYRIEGKYINSNLLEFIIETQGGTYIKELIHGDEGRTTPSFAEIFGKPLRCKELDVLEIKY